MIVVKRRLGAGAAALSAAWVAGGHIRPPAPPVAFLPLAGRRRPCGGVPAAPARSAVEARQGARVESGTTRLQRLGAGRLDGYGAARLAAARWDLTPGLPRRFLHREGGREAADMPEQTPNSDARPVKHQDVQRI